MKISELPMRSNLSPDSYIVVDGATGGTRRVRLDWLETAIAKLGSQDPWTSRSNPTTSSNETVARKLFRVCANNFTYRGKFLGTSVTSDQWTNIRNGKFNDLCIGDYWTITAGGYTYNWRIAVFDYERHHYYMNNTAVAPYHWIGVMPDELTVAGTSSANTASYGTDKQKLDLLVSVMGSRVTSAFGSSHLFKKPEVIITATGYPVTTAETSDYYMRLPNAVMLGLSDMQLPHMIAQNAYCNSGTGQAMGLTQLPLFRLNPDWLVPGYSSTSWSGYRSWLQENWGTRTFYYAAESGTLNHTTTGINLANMGLRPIVWLY